MRDSQLPTPPINPASRCNPETGPKMGEWYWVTHEKSETQKTVEELMCVTHLASNHVQFHVSDPDGGRSGVFVKYHELLSCTRPEPNWQAIIQKRMEAKQVELADAVKALADSVERADLIPDVTQAPTLLPAKTRQSPEECKKALVKLRDKTLPARQKDIEWITKELVALQRDLVLPMLAQADKIEKVTECIEDRLFALELYAGLWQKVKVLAEGEPAPMETPVTVRQMLRYMDEECLIDWDGGGMDYRKLDDFDAWVAKPEHLSRLAPEPRCVVAMKVRRYPKERECSTLMDFWIAIEEDREDEKTYLLIRNGQQAYRLVADLDFSPRLLPYRDEFVKPFTKYGGYDFDNHRDRETLVTPEDYDYDDVVEKRLKEIFKYNRVLFLVQGLLDRSKVFAPHPPINLADQEQVQRYFQAVFDEELGLPSANPPVWEEYRDAKNAQIRLGSWVYSKWYSEDDYGYDRFSHREQLRESRVRPTICQVTSIRMNRSEVRVSWPWGTRWGYEHRDVYGREYGKYGEWEVDRLRHAWIPMKEVFNVSTYVPGEYKPFLCDAYLKGAYLKWAPPLLTSEKWHKEQKEQK